MSTHPLLVPRVTKSGAIPLLPLHAFMAWAGAISPFFVVNYKCIYKKVHLMKSKIKHAGTWSAATWPPRCLCYRPAVSPTTFVYCDFISATNIRLFKRMLLFELLTFLWSFVILMLCNLKFRKLVSVCSLDSKPTVTEGLQETSQPYSAPWVAFYHVSGNCGLQSGGPVATNYFRRTHETEYGRLCKKWPRHSQKLLTGGRISVWHCSNHSWPSHWTSMCPRHIPGWSFIPSYIAYLRKRA